MKNRILALFIILNIPLLLVAQSYEVGPPYEVVKAPEKYYFNKGNQIIAVKVEESHFTIQKMDALSLAQLNTKEYDDFPQRFVLEKVKQIQGRVFIFYSLWDKENENEQLFYREVDFDKGELKESKKLITVKGKIKGTLVAIKGYYKTIDKFDFQWSKDESKMLISYRHVSGFRDNDITYGIIGVEVFDKDLNLLWKKGLKMPYAESKMGTIHYSVDGDENVYMVSRVKKDNITVDDKNKDDKKVDYNLEILKYEAETANLVKTKIAIKDKFIQSVRIFEISPNEMFCSGFYSYNGDYSSVNGVFTIRMDKEGGKSSVNYYEIPEETLDLDDGEKKKKKHEEKAHPEIKNLDLKQLVTDKDGSFLLIAERNYVISYGSYNSNSAVLPSTKRYIEDIVITKIDTTGSLHWMKILPKKQASRKGMTDELSYKYMAGKGCHYFIFLDNPLNKSLTPIQVPKYYRINGDDGGYVTVFKVSDERGEVSRIPVLDTKDVNGQKVYQFMPTKILPVSDSDFVLEVYKKKKEDELIRIHLK